MSTTLHVINHTGDHVGIYVYGGRVATVTGGEACVKLDVSPSEDVVLGFKRTADSIVYAQPTYLGSMPYWEVVIERSTRDGSFWPYAIRYGCTARR